jgi:hypothetical protein
MFWPTLGKRKMRFGNFNIVEVCLIVLLKDFNVWISDEICKIIKEKS